MTYACGLVWFANAKVAGEKYGFDPSTGELRAAHSFTPGGPVTSPCHTFSVHAGERTACGSQLSLNNPESSFDYNPETTETCGCTIAEDDPDFSEFACQTRNWYQDLMAAVEPLSD